MIFDEKKNIGRFVTIKGKKEKIIYILSDGHFRIESEINGPIISNYDLSDIEEAQILDVSFNNGITWVKVALARP